MSNAKQEMFQNTLTQALLNKGIPAALLAGKDEKELKKLATSFGIDVKGIQNVVRGSDVSTVELNHHYTSKKTGEEHVYVKSDTVKVGDATVGGLFVRQTPDTASALRKHIKECENAIKALEEMYGVTK